MARHECLQQKMSVYKIHSGKHQWNHDKKATLRILDSLQGFLWIQWQNIRFIWGVKGDKRRIQSVESCMHCSSWVMLQENSNHWSNEGKHEACRPPIIIPQYTGDAAERLTPVPMMNEAEPETYEHHQSDSLPMALA